MIFFSDMINLLFNWHISNPNHVPFPPFVVVCVHSKLVNCLYYEFKMNLLGSCDDKTLLPLTQNDTLSAVLNECYTKAIFTFTVFIDYILFI